MERSGAAAVGRNVPASARRPPHRQARLDHDRPGPVDRALHPPVAVRVADDVDVGFRNRLAFANDESAREGVLGLARGDVGGRTQLDDDRRLAECHVAGDLDGAARDDRRFVPRRASRLGSCPVGEAVHAAGSVTQPPFGHAGRKRVDDRDHRVLPEVVAHAQGVGACLDRLHRRLDDPDRLAHRLHLERIGEDDAVEAELAAQQPAQHRRVDRGGQRADADVCGHDRRDSGGDRRAEGRQAVLDVADERRQLEMRVLGRRAVTRKVLRAGRDPPRLKAAHVGGDMAGDELGVVAERAGADHGVRRNVHIGDRSEVPVHADRRELGGDRAGDLLGRRDVVDDTEGGAAGIRAALPPLEPRHVAPLLVERQQDPGRSARSAVANPARASRVGTL